MTELIVTLLEMPFERANKVMRLKVHQEARTRRRDSVSAPHIILTGLVRARDWWKPHDRECLIYIAQYRD